VMTIARGVQTAKTDFKCPSCGTRPSEGGCLDAKKCLEAVGSVDLENVYLREITNLVDDYADNRPFYLLMAGFEVFDLLNIGLGVTDIKGRLLLANRTAEQILNARDGLALNARGVIRSSEGYLLSEHIERTLNAVPTEASDVNPVALAIPRPSGKRPLTVLLRSARTTSAQPESAGTALLFILDPEISLEIAENELHELYGFTSAEARLANLLMEGLSLAECCNRLGVRRATACTHLRQLFKKTGVRRQSELVSVLFKSIGLVRTTGEERRKWAVVLDSPIQLCSAKAGRQAGFELQDTRQSPHPAPKRPLHKLTSESSAYLNR